MIRKPEMHISPMFTYPLKRLDLVQAYVCELMPTRFLGDALYFVTFINDATRKVWIYPIKGKDDVYPTFIKFIATSVELEKDINIKAL